ncbi:hypothetical protein [Methanococcoides seepicolus]|uniref:Uncharacterized protein n=1 Tax=Methanococcoides seepicolus TaxID=2828780 RepID=A0A9E4ZER4_9EURY|nr:hypothetical protein [Methanococcoides seepicolus]MCM1986300.1 hypothetical protein [Methanococcoides seepicolus]
MKIELSGNEKAEYLEKVKEAIKNPKYSITLLDENPSTVLMRYSMDSTVS